jgi:hypothetical protein
MHVGCVCFVLCDLGGASLNVWWATPYDQEVVRARSVSY